jgi:hypothetical protein
MLSAPSSVTSAAGNWLAGETSPYLLQHAHNPVAWHPWGEHALTLARQLDKPILLSIGYSACHWCHVMAHESFEDEAVAATMNRLFVNIKVDREERPDLDQIYQTAHQVLTQRAGGWPLTMFLTPDGCPFYGGTYFPKEPRYGLPGFADLCTRVADAYAGKKEDIRAQNAEILRVLATTVPTAPTGGAELSADPMQRAIDSLAESFDPQWGGFGGAPKFPHPAELALLMYSGQEQPMQMALFTLRRMFEGGIYDQIGGGFARYSVDERWEIPHFEKMLYDNGPLLALHADAWTLTGDPDFRRVVEETAVWVAREMTAADGAFYSSLDADSEGEEGKYYIWQRDELAGCLSAEESALAGRRWGFAGPPNFEGHAWHPRIAAALAPEERELAELARGKLFAARERRVRPARDDKVLTSWNALMIGGLARAARVFGRADWRRAAQTATDFLRREHWREGRLLATSKDGRAHLDAYLDDHAFLLAALLELLQAEFRPSDLEFATDLAEALLARFEDAAAGGFHFTAHDHEVLIHRPKSGHDNATPSGNGVAAWALQRLGHLVGDSRYIAAAERCLRLFWPQVERSPAGFSSMLMAAAEALRPPSMVILRGPRDAVEDWKVRLGASPHRVVLAIPNGTTEDGKLPSVLVRAESDSVRAWVCRGVECLPPISDFRELNDALLAA